MTAGTGSSGAGRQRDLGAGVVRPTSRSEIIAEGVKDGSN